MACSLPEEKHGEIGYGGRHREKNRHIQFNCKYVSYTEDVGSKLRGFSRVSQQAHAQLAIAVD